MDEHTVPLALSDVAGSLREADEYTRLQAIRQRGLYNILTGLPGFLLIAPFWMPYVIFADDPSSSPWKIALPFLTWGLFFLACVPQAFLPLVRRLRPDWQSPLLAANPLKKGLEKQFWFQFPFWYGYYLLTPVVLIFLAFSQRDEIATIEGLERIVTVGLLLNLVFLVAGPLTLAWQARRTGDRTLAAAFLVWVPVGTIMLLFDPTSQTPSIFGMALLALALVTPPMLVGLARMLTPRRWLFD